MQGRRRTVAQGISDRRSSQTDTRVQRISPSPSLSRSPSLACSRERVLPSCACVRRQMRWTTQTERQRKASFQDSHTHTQERRRGERTSATDAWEEGSGADAGKANRYSGIDYGSNSRHRSDCRCCSTSPPLVCGSRATEASDNRRDRERMRRRMQCERRNEERIRERISKRSGKERHDAWPHDGE